MTTISSVDIPSSRTGSTSASSRQGSSKQSASLGKILKTAGVLALALTGGAQARPLDSYSHTRNLNDYIDENHEPYGYKTLCDSGIVDHYVKGMSYEACMAEENKVIDDLRASKPLSTLRRCYTGSGSLAGALSGVGLLSLIGGTSAGLAASATSFSLALVSLLPTAICGGVYATIKHRIGDSRKEAKDCCEHLPKQAVVDANAASAVAKNNSNATAAANSSAPSNASMVVSSATASSFNSTTVVSTVTTLNNKIVNNTIVNTTAVTLQRNL